MSIFKKNYLPAQSQPWARQVEDRIRFFEGGLNTLDVNNRSKDEQFAAALNRLNAATITAQASADAAADAAATANGIINNIYTKDEVGQPTTLLNGTKVANGTIGIAKLVASEITGDVINGGTITGVVLQTAATGTRVKVEGQKIEFYGGTAGLESLQGEITGSAGDFGNGLYIKKDLTSIYMGGVGGDIGFNVLGTRQFRIGGGNVQSEAAFSATNGLSVSGGATIAGGLNVGTITSTGSSSFSSTLFNTGAPATSNDANVYLATNGRFEKSTAASTIEVKENIRPLEFDLEKFISTSPVIFDYKDGIVSDNSGKDVIGFIAEDFEDAGLAAELVKPAESENDFKSLRYNKLYMFLHKVVQEQNETIKSLEARLTALESR